MEIRRLSILGVGLLGGSLGLAVRHYLKDVSIGGYGHRAATLEKALHRRAIDESFDDPVAAVTGADFVILCTPVGAFEELLTRIAPALATGAIVTDVGSTKRTVIQAAGRVLPKGVHFVGSHPMAGSEKRGIEFATRDLFHGSTCILTPTPETDLVALNIVDHLWTKVGMKTTKLSPSDHDRLLALVSHLPHAAAAAIMRAQDERGIPLAGNGFKDVTRIAAGDAGLWRDIFLDNADYLCRAIADARGELDVLSQLLERRDSAGIEAWLAEAAKRRAAVSPKVGQ
jgi:prephenate dehydrogenase